MFLDAQPGGRPAVAWRGRPPLLTRRLLARVGLHPADFGTARYGGRATRRRLLRFSLGASLAGHSASPCGLTAGVVRTFWSRAPRPQV